MFDLNKTILLSDQSSDESIKDVINDMIAQRSTGTPLKYDESLDDVQRLMNSDEIDERIHCFHRFHSSGMKDLITYYDYIKKLYDPEKYKNEKNYSSIKKELEKRIKFALYNYTNKGFPGKDLSDEFNDILKKMERMVPIGDDDHGKYYYILPAFYEFVLHLHKNFKNGGPDFKIVFRTFGEDITDVMKEFNDFCNGKHPDYPNVELNGKNGSKDIRLTLQNIGHFYFEGTDVDNYNCMLIKATNDSNPIINDANDIYKEMTDVNGGTLAIKDHYQWWDKHNRTYHAGKLMLFNEKKDDGIFQLFFDDNVHTKDKKKDGGILNIRSSNTGKSVALSELLGDHVHHVDPMHVIKDKNYFIRRLPLTTV